MHVGHAWLFEMQTDSLWSFHVSAETPVRALCRLIEPRLSIHYQTRTNGGCFPSKQYSIHGPTLGSLVYNSVCLRRAHVCTIVHWVLNCLLRMDNVIPSETVLVVDRNEQNLCSKHVFANTCFSSFFVVL